MPEDALPIEVRNTLRGLLYIWALTFVPLVGLGVMLVAVPMPPGGRVTSAGMLVCAVISVPTLWRAWRLAFGSPADPGAQSTGSASFASAVIVAADRYRDRTVQAVVIGIGVMAFGFATGMVMRQPLVYAAFAGLDLVWLGAFFPRLSALRALLPPDARPELDRVLG